MFHPSVIELSKSAFRHNLRFLRNRLSPSTVFCSVIKGNAYGHGIKNFLPMAEACGVRQFAVFDASEALEAFESREADSEIFIMGAIDDPAAIEWAVENGVGFYIFDTERLEVAIAAARKIGKPARIHLELETGLNRMGLYGENLDTAIEMVRCNPKHAQVDGTCTHFAGAESIANYVRIQKQLESYTLTCMRLEQMGFPLGRRHTACSAAALRFPETQMDMARIGIAQYGFWPNRETEMDYMLSNGNVPRAQMVRTLRRMLRWSSRVMNVKTVRPGEFIGYGTSYQTTTTQRIAAVPVGYFHGFTRNLSNLGMVLIHGRRAQVVGSVNMNMTLVDVTHIPNVQKGDEVVIIGRQNKAHIDVASFSDMTRIMNYELLVRLPSEIPRVIVN